MQHARTARCREFRFRFFLEHTADNLTLLSENSTLSSIKCPCGLPANIYRLSRPESPCAEFFAEKFRLPVNLARFLLSLINSLKYSRILFQGMSLSK
jgi:hypothetical protein